MNSTRYMVVNKKTKIVDSIIKSVGNLTSTAHDFISVPDNVSDEILLNCYMKSDNTLAEKPTQEEFDDIFVPELGEWKRSEDFKNRVKKTPEIEAEEKVLMLTNPINLMEICDIDKWVSDNVKTHDDIVDVLKNIIISVRSFSSPPFNK